MGKLKSKPKDSKNCSRALRILSEKLKIALSGLAEVRSNSPPMLRILRWCVARTLVLYWLLLRFFQKSKKN